MKLRMVPAALAILALATAAQATQPHWGAHFNQDTYNVCGSNDVTIQVYFDQALNLPNQSTSPANRVQLALVYKTSEFDFVSVTRGSDVPASADFLAFSGTCNGSAGSGKNCVRMEAWDATDFEAAGTYHWATVVLSPKVTGTLTVDVANSILSIVVDCWNEVCNEYWYEPGVPGEWELYTLGKDSADINVAASCGSSGCEPNCELEKPRTTWGAIKNLYK